MAFDSTIIVLGRKYDDSTPGVILDSANSILSKFGIKVDRAVPSKEYDQMTSSKEINRYIRVKKMDLTQQKREATELIKVGTTRLQAFERFASAKYAFFSVAGLEDGAHTVVWFSFHSRLSRAFSEFHDFSYQLAKLLSARLNTEGYAMEVSSFSRNSDRFVLYVHGRERHKLSTKGALTEVKKLYGLDINQLMTNIDRNMAIHYAPMDYREIQEEVRMQERRYSEWQKHRDEIMIKNQEDGSNMMEAFEQENEVVMTALKGRLSIVEQALKTDPIGKIVYFKMTDMGVVHSYESENERLFGREVDSNAEANV